MQAGEDYSPPTTFIVAQKRHNTRFFPGRDADRSGNAPPGTRLVCALSLPKQPTLSPIGPFFLSVFLAITLNYAMQAAPLSSIFRAIPAHLAHWGFLEPTSAQA